MESFPRAGSPKPELLAQVRELQSHDIDWRNGRIFSQVYVVSDEYEQALLEAYAAAFSLNALSPRAFPSLLRLEQEVVEMAADLFGLPSASGCMTGGGSESNLLALKSARDRMRKERPDLREPEIVVPVSAHPSISKAAHFLGLVERRVQVSENQEADLDAIASVINPNTILLVGSAPSWPHGIVDPIVGLGEIAVSNGLLLHIDACLGGFVLPFARELGRQFSAFDFSVPGVSSISADLHKFGYAAKGASLVLHREAAGFESQVYDFVNWTGGRYRVATMSGTRAGGAISASWFALRYLGRTGYVRIVKTCLQATDKLIEGISSIPGLYIIGEPPVNLFAFGSSTIPIDAISEGMRERGWLLGLQGRPPSSIHLSVNPVHARVVDDFTRDLADVIDGIAAGRIEVRSAEGTYN